MDQAGDQQVTTCNEVRLVGRLAAEADSRTLPSGDTVALVRVVVDRPATRRSGAGRAPSVDTVDCAIWTAALRRRAASLKPGTVIEVEGSLRRRFWRAPGGGAVSRYEVEVSAVRVVRASGAAPPPRPKASRVRSA